MKESARDKGRLPEPLLRWIVKYIWRWDVPISSNYELLEAAVEKLGLQKEHRRDRDGT